MTAATIARVLSGLLIAIRGLSSSFAIPRSKLVALLATASGEDRDVGADEVQALIDAADAALDKLDEAIDAYQV